MIVKYSDGKIDHVVKVDEDSENQKKEDELKEKLLSDKHNKS